MTPLKEAWLMSKLLISAFIKLNKRERSANQVALFCLHQTKLVVHASSVTMLPQFSISSIEESLFYISGFDYSKLFNRNMLDESMRLSEEHLKTQCANIWSSTFVLQNLQVYKSEVFKQLGLAMLSVCRSFTYFPIFLHFFTQIWGKEFAAGSYSTS